MTHTPRLHRSELAVPGSNVRMLEKAPSLGADIVMLDLEDAVAPDEKDRARELAISALLELDWSACSVSVRINGLDTPWCYRDVVEVVERAGERLDLQRTVGPHPDRAAPGDGHGEAGGLRAVERRTIDGKIVVYPCLADLPLTPLGELPGSCPAAAAALRDGGWCLEAETALLTAAPRN